MCYKVECKQCKKTSWGGCGKHVASVYNGIEKGKHCMCKSWPGVAAAYETTAAAADATAQSKGKEQAAA